MVSLYFNGKDNSIVEVILTKNYGNLKYKQPNNLIGVHQTKIYFFYCIPFIGLLTCVGKRIAYTFLNFNNVCEKHFGSY